VNTYIVLLRGINVGGKNIIKMKDLVALLEDLGAKQVKTYIQSGNVVFQSMKEPSQLSEKIDIFHISHSYNHPMFAMIINQWD